jgi:hypothetical protein
VQTYFAANLGGQIRHTEIAGGAPANDRVDDHDRR